MVLRALLSIGLLFSSAAAGAFAAPAPPPPAGEAPSDDRIHDLVMVKLAGDQLVAGAGRIEVFVEGGVVTLKGRVESDQQRGRAERLAKKVKGVKSVNNQIKVEPR